jgi:hypothetical protein
MPLDLERYQKLLPDAPERLLASGEREQAHRHEIEQRLAALDESSMPKFYEGQRRGLRRAVEAARVLLARATSSTPRSTAAGLVWWVLGKAGGQYRVRST